jgi:predicted Zn-dependent peptidase
MSTILDIKQSKLSNGMIVITDHMPSVETVSLGVWVNAGTRHEAPARPRRSPKRSKRSAAC